MVKLWIMGLTCALLALGCNWTDGQCWYRGEGGDFGTGVGVGGSFGVSVGAGVGGRGDHADPRSDEDPRVPPACNEGEGEEAERPKVDTPGVAGYPASLFKFKTTVEDDGAGAAGGWQEAQATLTFVDMRAELAMWKCDLTVGMPKRTAAQGVLTAERAAKMTASAATAASATVMHSQPAWIRAMYCPAFAKELVAELSRRYPNLGARARAR